MRLHVKIRSKHNRKALNTGITELCLKRVYLLMFWRETLIKLLANNISNNNKGDAINGHKLTLICFKLYKDILTHDIVP